MPQIAVTDAMGLYTRKLVAVYKDRPKPTSFLRSFFPSVLSPTLEVSIQVQRSREKVAVDVQRGDSGNRNQWTRSTEKTFIPPYFRERFDITKLQLYDRLYGAQSIDDAIFAALINDIVDHQLELREKIERNIELQCKQVLETGVVTGATFSIDYKRKAASIVNANTLPTIGGYWTTGATDVFAQIAVGCKFIRTVGKMQGGTFNFIMGEDTAAALFKNTTFLNRQNLFNMKLDDVMPPQANAVGADFHGQITCGVYRVNLWSYPEFYDDANNVSQPYINPKLGILLPEKTKFVTAFGAVPQIVNPGALPIMGEFIMTDYKDVDARAHYYDVEACPLAVPVAIDTMWTIQTVA